MICRIFRYNTDSRIVQDGETVGFIVAMSTVAVSEHMKSKGLSLRDYGYVTMSNEGAQAEIEKMEKRMVDLKDLIQKAKNCIEVNGGMV